MELKRLTQMYYNRGFNILEARAKAEDRIAFEKSVETINTKKKPKRAFV